MKANDQKHPMQPIGWDETGKTVRFKANKIVRMLLDEGPFDLNEITCIIARDENKFNEDDYTQLMQLIGYSVSGYGELKTSPKELVEKADTVADSLGFVCTEETPYDETKHKDIRPVVHPKAVEVCVEDTRDGDLVTYECSICKTRWKVELGK